MPAFRALRDLFGRSDESKRSKPEQAVTKLQALQEAAREAAAPPAKPEVVKPEAAPQEVPPKREEEQEAK